MRGPSRRRRFPLQPLNFFNPSTLAHMWLAKDPVFVVLTVFTAALSVWAWRLHRRMV